MVLDPIPDELKDLKELEKVLIFKRVLFKKIAIMYGKGEFFKINGSICNILTEAANICNILPRSAVSGGLIVVKLKRNLKYRGHVYFELVRPYIVYQAITYLKSYNKFYEDISIAKGLSGEDMFKFSDTSETEFASAEDPLNIHRTASNATTFVSEILDIINDENVIIAAGEGKKSVSIVSDKFCEEQTFPYLLPKGKFGCDALRDILVNPA